MECFRSPARGFQARPPLGPGGDDIVEFRPWRQSAWRAVPPPPVCPAPRKREFPAGGSVPMQTRQSLVAQRLVIMFFAAGALWNRQLAIGSPGQQPGLHVLVLDVVSRLDLAIRLTNLGQHSLLIGDVNFHSVRNQKIRAAPGGLRQPRQALLGVRFEPDAKGCTPCVCHEHTLARRSSPALARVTKFHGARTPYFTSGYTRSNKTQSAAITTNTT